MSSNDRRAAARRKAWGRGPHILRFEPLEGRQLLSAADPVAVLSEVADLSTQAATASAPAVDATTTAAVVATSLASASSAAPAASATSSPAAPAAKDSSELVATAFSTANNLDWGDDFRAVGAIKNDGTGATPVAYSVDVYASLTPTPGPDAVLVGSVPIPAGLAPGASAAFDQPMAAPPVPLTNLGDAPSYYLTPKIAPAPGAAVESRPALSASTLTSVVTITPKIPPKLVGAGVNVSPGSVSWGDTITVTARVLNDADGAAPPTNARIILTPIDKTPGLGSDYQIGQVPIPPISPHQTVSASQKITLPKYAPNALAGSNKYVVTMLQDADATANPLILPFVPSSPQNTTALTIASPGGQAAPPVAKKPAPADLVPTNVQQPTPVMFRGATFPVGATIQNNGPGDAGEFKVRFLLVTDDAPDAPALALGDATIPGLKANMKIDVLQTVKIPYRTPEGFEIDSPTARIVAVVDPDHAIDQTNSKNDSLAAAPVQLRLLTPDAQTNLPTLPGTPASTTTGTGTGTTTGGAGTTATTAPTSTMPTEEGPTDASQAAETGVVAAPTSTPTPTVAKPGKPGGATVRTQVMAKTKAARAAQQAKAKAARAAQAAKLKAARDARVARAQAARAKLTVQVARTPGPARG